MEDNKPKTIKVRAWRVLFMFYPGTGFIEIPGCPTPATGDTVVYKNENYKVKMVKHNIEGCVTEVVCVR